MKMNKRGFTLIELLTVIAIIGILVLMSAPKFLGYTEKANIVKIQSGIKAVETAVDLKSMDNPEFTKDWVVLTPDKLQEINDSGKLIDKNGFIKEDLEGGKNVPLKDLDNVKWNGGGEFIINPDDDSVYYYNKDINVSKKTDGSATIPSDNNGDGSDNGGTTPEPPVEEPKEPEITYPIVLPNGDLQHEDGKVTTPDGEGVRQPDGSAIYPNGNVLDKDGNLSTMRPDGILVHSDESVTLKDGTKVPVASNTDFIWQPEDTENSYTIPGKGKGFYNYVGEKTEVVIPSEIDGNELTSYYGMFYDSSVTRVVSLNENITNLDLTFFSHKGVSLDVSVFETKNVVSMQDTFSFSEATSLDLRNWDTSNVVNMKGMFLAARATSLDLSSFNTYKVTNMASMFASARDLSLDLSSFNTFNVTDMSSMFNGSQATSLDLSSFNTSNVTDMGSMFADSQATTLDLSSFTINSGTNISTMFEYAEATVGYARTASDATRLNSNATNISSYKLNFIVK